MMRDPDGQYRYENGMIIPKRFYDALATSQLKIEEAIYTIEENAERIEQNAEDEEDGEQVLNTAKHILNMCKQFGFIIGVCDGDINATGDNRAKWIAETNCNYSPFDPTKEEYIYFCSACSKKQYKRTRFCPECGRWMVNTVAIYDR